MPAHSSQRMTVLVYAFFCAGLMAWMLGRPVGIWGDGWEYLYQIESLSSRMHPAVTDADLDAVAWQAEHGHYGQPPTPPYFIRTAPDGRRYGLHFWAYPLSAVPMNLLLKACGGNPAAAMQMTNAIWYLLGIGVTLFAWNLPNNTRWLFVGISAVGPAFYYLEFTGPELYSWALVQIAVTAIAARKYGWSAFAASLAALQNPACGLLGGVAVLLHWREIGIRGSWRPVAACAVSLLPFAFYQYHFGTPSLITAGFTNPRNISLIRSWSMVADFNQGLLPFMPVLVIGGIIAIVRLISQGSLRAILLTGCVIAMGLSVQVQQNWNSGCIGVQRYLIWMVPILAWLAVQGLADLPAGRTLLSLGILFQAAGGYLNPPNGDYLEHRPLARWMLNHYPEFYLVETEIFVERTVHIDLDAQKTRLSTGMLPVGYARPDGTISKMLIGAGNLEELQIRMQADPEYLETLRTVHDPSEWRFEHPPYGVLKMKKADIQAERIAEILGVPAASR